MAFACLQRLVTILIKTASVIDGYCASACMVMADRARPRTCITSRAVLGYHKTNFGRPIPLRGDPRFGARPGTMPNSVARQFFPMCKDSVASL